jgi:hypothetical protein
MRSILTSLTFLLFLAWSCVVLGGSLYEAVAVWPLVASHPPESLAVTNQVLAVAERAGMFFWSTATPGLGLVALAALLTSFASPRPDMTWRIASTALVLIVIAATLLYFRPTIIRLVTGHGGGQPDEEIAAQMRQWVLFNWVRISALVVSVGMALGALVFPKELAGSR